MFYGIFIIMLIKCLYKSAQARGVNMIIDVYSEDETRKLGYEMGRNAKAGEVYCLKGDLGVGKTVFTKGFAEGLEISEHITSPTFTIVNEYLSGRLPFYHFDVYRIGDPEEMYDIGYEEYLFGDGVCLIEWAELIKEILPENVKWIEISKNLTVDDVNYRRIEVL